MLTLDVAHLALHQLLLCLCVSACLGRLVFFVFGLGAVEFFKCLKHRRRAGELFGLLDLCFGGQPAIEHFLDLLRRVDAQLRDRAVNPDHPR